MYERMVEWLRVKLAAYRERIFNRDLEEAILRDRFETRRIWRVHSVGGGVYETAPMRYADAMREISTGKKRAIHVDFDNSFIFVRED